MNKKDVSKWRKLRAQTLAELLMKAEQTLLTAVEKGVSVSDYVRLSQMEKDFGWAETATRMTVTWLDPWQKAEA